jgi:hypothetical protein
MCITKVPAFQFAGKLYLKELDAVKAALAEIGGEIIRNHSAHPHAGLVAHTSDLLFLLRAHQRLVPTDQSAEIEALPVASGEPKDQAA